MSIPPTGRVLRGANLVAPVCDPTVWSRTSEFGTLKLSKEGRFRRDCLSRTRMCWSCVAVVGNKRSAEHRSCFKSRTSHLCHAYIVRWCILWKNPGLSVRVFFSVGMQQKLSIGLLFAPVVQCAVLSRRGPGFNPRPGRNLYGTLRLSVAPGPLSCDEQTGSLLG